MKNIISITFALILGVAGAWGQTRELTGGVIYTVAPAEGENTVTLNETLVIPTTGGPVTIYIPAGVTLTINGSDGTDGGNGLEPSSGFLGSGLGGGPQDGGTGGTGAMPAISVPQNATLIITGEGILNVKGGDAGAGGPGGNGQAGQSGTNNYGGAGGSGGGGGGGAAAAIGGYGGNGGNGGKGGTAGANSGIVVGEGDGGPGAAGITSGIEGIDMGNVYIIGNVTLVTHEYNTKALHGINGQNGAYDTGITLYYFGGRGGNGGFSGSVPYAIGGGGYGGYGGNGGDGGNIRKKDSNPTQPDNPAQTYDNTQTGDNGNLYIQNTTLNQPALNSNAYDPTHKSEITSNAQMPSAIAATFTIDGESTPLRSIFYGTVIENMNLTTAEMTRTGYTFNGYKIKGTSTAVYDANGIFVYPITKVASSTDNTQYVSLQAPGNIVLEAVWTANTYTVQFDKQNGSGGTTSVNATYDSAMPPATAPSRAGYTFAGYYTSANGGGTQYYDENMVSVSYWHITTNPSTLYANWTANTYTLNFDVQNGDALSPSTQSVTYDAAYGTLPTPTRYGFAFKGWYTTPNGGSETDTEVLTSDIYSIDGDQTIYAHWNTIVVDIDAYSAEEQLTDNYFRTFYDSQIAHILPDGVKAYKGKIEGNYLVLTAIEAKDDEDNDIIPKNVPVILRMMPNEEAGVPIPGNLYQIKTKQISLTTSESELTIDNTDNELIGSDIVIATAVANSYILSFGSNGLGFYEWSTHPLEAHKAYVIKDSANPAKALTFRFEDDVTGINDAITEFKSDSSQVEIYNLNGIRLSKPQKGINIINGRKFWMK